MIPVPSLECNDTGTISIDGYRAQAIGGTDTWNINFPLDQQGMGYLVRIVAPPLANEYGSREFKVTFAESINPVCLNIFAVSTVTETKAFLCESPVETTTVYGRVYSSSSRVVTAYDAGCEKKVVSTDGWYCCQCAPAVISYVPCPDDNSPYVWGFYEKIDVSVSVDVDHKVEVPVIELHGCAGYQCCCDASTASTASTTSIASETTSTDAELCSSIPPYTPGVVYAVGYDATAEDFEYVANGGYRSAVSTPLDASLDSSGKIVQETTYQPLLELMFFASGTFEISQLVSNTDSAYGYIFAGQSAMSCNDIKEIGSGEGQYAVGMSGQYYVVREISRSSISSTTALVSSAYCNSVTLSAGYSISAIGSSVSASLVGTASSDIFVSTPSVDSYVSTTNPTNSASSSNIPRSVSSTALYSYASSSAVTSPSAIASSSAVVSSSAIASPSITIMSFLVCTETPQYSPGVQFVDHTGDIGSFSKESIAI
ncbi:hypothetical protein CANCADRAFT_1316 [Tortispora caseinolytica NRRL Y-17796]|uniref:Uncharacterized protein n=1 Tax=Tortispora caseinolytica NRRL Y-17796 TaxID=767744 RepID=A0A1E4TLU2_9ASCO|nr:hypothetical protein CANCADRAFT_1316 [Tortispora caseinolytica NRRL Y-17796]